MTSLFDELAQIAATLNDQGIRYAVVGGLAYALWVEARMTEDIDLLILPEDWPKVKLAMEPLDFHERALPMDFSNIRIRRLTKLDEDRALVLDFLFAEGDFARSLDRSVKFTLAGKPLMVAPPDVIIKLKEGRMSDKDRLDIAGLKRKLEEEKRQ